MVLFFFSRGTLTPRGSPTARKYSRRLSPSQVCGSAVSLFSSGASSQTVINCFCLAYPPLRPKRPFLTVFFHCLSYNKFS